MNTAQHLSPRAFQPIPQPPITFNAYGNQMKPVTIDDLINKNHFLARSIEAGTDYIVEVISYSSGVRWMPCAFHRFKFENDALYWVEAINANVDLNKMINGLFKR
jgi:hypothetical protein